MFFEESDAILERITAKINVVSLGYNTPCYIWTGSNSQQKKGNPYGRISILGCTTAVHLYLWKRFNGPIRKKYQIDHKCNNTLCVRLDHLQMVTNLKNQRLRASRAKEKAREQRRSSFTCDDAGRRASA